MPPVEKNTEYSPPLLSVVIPCYNEVHSIRQILNIVHSVEPFEKEVIVVDDYSTDGTRELLANELKEHYNQLILQPKNMGKGAALRTGFAKAKGRFVLIQDADLEYDPNDYGVLLGPLINDKADIVFGSRFVGGRPHRVVYFWHMVGNKFLTLLSNMFTNLNLTDMECCYKVFRSDIIQKISIEESRFGIEPEITAKAAKLKPRIYEVGISYYGRTYLEGKKIGWKDGVRAMYAIVKYNLFR